MMYICIKCNRYLAKIELEKGRCPECGGRVAEDNDDVSEVDDNATK